MRNIPQPAPQLYVFDRGWRVMRYSLVHILDHMYRVAKWWFDKVTIIAILAYGKQWIIRCCVYVLASCVVLVAFIQCLAMLVVVTILFVIYAFVLAGWLGINLTLIGFFAVFTSLNAKFKAIFYCCPNCHRSMPIPVFLCPSCGVGHSRLQPSRYGIFWHQCSGNGSVCGAKIPTLDILGRSELKNTCAHPRCGRPLNRGIGKGSNIHIPIVGGTSVGKTSYMIMALDSFIRTYETKHDYTFSFPDPLHQENFERNLHRLAVGRELPITPDIVPQAYNLIFKAPKHLLRPKGFVPKLLYLYDAAGEIFGSNEQMDLQDYYEYTKGIIFIIDPFSIQSVITKYRNDINKIEESLRPSSTGIMEIYERIKEEMEKVKKKKFSMPIAIVINKVDVFELENEIGLAAALNLMAQDPKITTIEDAISILVRKFFCESGLDNFVRDLELSFSKVKYFSCSALGRLPSQVDTSGFISIRVIEPVVWLLSQV